MAESSGAIWNGDTHEDDTHTSLLLCVSFILHLCSAQVVDRIRKVEARVHKGNGACSHLNVCCDCPWDTCFVWCLSGAAVHCSNMPFADTSVFCPSDCGPLSKVLFPEGAISNTNAQTCNQRHNSAGTRRNRCIFWQKTTN